MQSYTGAMGHADCQTRPRLTSGQFALWLLVGFFCSLLFDTDARSPVVFLFGLALGFGALLFSVVSPRQWSIAPLLIVLLNAPDLTQSAEEVTEHGLIRAANPWQAHLGPLTPAMLMAAVLLLVSLRFLPARRMYDLAMILYFVIVVPTASCINGYAQQSLSWFFTDSKLAFFFCTSIILLDGYYRRYPNKLLVYGQVFLAIAAGRYMLDAYYLFGGVHRTEISGFNRVSLDSAKGMLTVFVFLSAAVLVFRRRRLGALLIMPVAVYLLLAYQTRWLVITLILGGVLVLFSIGARRASWMVVIIAALGMVVTPLLVKLRPDVLEVLTMRFSSFRLLIEEGDLAAVDSTRIASIANSIELLKQRKALLTGLGYGSWYTDDAYPMLGLNQSDFDGDSLSSRRFFRVHDFCFHLLFKVGVIGLLLYLGAFLFPLGLLWTNRRKIVRDKNAQIVFVVLIGLAPMVITTLFWTAKGLIIAGFYVATLRAWQREWSTRIRLRCRRTAGSISRPVGLGSVGSVPGA